MDATDINGLDKEVKRLKRIAGEWGAKLHDLAEEGLPAAYLEIPAVAQSTFDACKTWAEANARLAALNINKGE